MSYQGLTTLAIIPARGGSKGIPRKNLCEIGGRSLVGITADLIKEIDWIDCAIVSTDDAEIAEEARRYQIDVPFMRPAALASDTALAIDAWQHAWLAAEDYYNRRFDIALWLQPTSPLRRSADLEKTMHALVSSNGLSATTISKVPGHYSPQKTLEVNNEGLLKFYLENGESFSNRQAIGDYYFRNGYCYAAKREAILTKKTIIGNHCVGVVIDRPTVNIDEPSELKLAAWMYQQGEY